MKKTLAILLALAMLLSVFAGCGKNGKATAGTNSNAIITKKEILDKKLRAAFQENETFSGGTGTEADPWLISSADDLFRLAAQINGETKDYTYREAHYCLTADIDLGNKNWMPIGVGDIFGRYGFCGVFDGGGYTVSGMKAIFTDQDEIRDIGLFGSVNGTVKNLTVAASELDTSKTDKSVATGAVAGTLDYGGMIQNCHVAADVIVYGGYETGGVVGDCSGMITDCTNAAAITGAVTVGYAGGIAGNFSGTPTLNLISGIMKNCSNTGAVVSEGGNTGGVVGMMMGDAELTGCSNTGSISGKENAGGIAGLIYSGEITVTDCVNSGSVTGKEACGGIVGTASGGCTATLSNCTNSGDVTAGKYLGGVVGMFMSSSQSTSLKIAECSNSADIYGSNWEEIADAGGILGLSMTMGGSIHLENSSNTGDVDGGNGNGGGVLGGHLSALGGEDNTMTIDIIGCDNTGNVSGGSYGVGGIAGDIDASGYPAVDCRITDCSNSGNLYARGNNVLLGGIVGTMEPHRCIAFIGNCSNSGSMTCEKTELSEGDMWFPFRSAMGGVIGYIGAHGIAPSYEDDCGLGDRVVITVSCCSSTGSINTNGTDIPVSTDEICAMSAVKIEIR